MCNSKDFSLFHHSIGYTINSSLAFSRLYRVGVGGLQHSIKVIEWREPKFNPLLWLGPAIGLPWILKRSPSLSLVRCLVHDSVSSRPEAPWSVCVRVCLRMCFVERTTLLPVEPNCNLLTLIY